MNSASTHAGDVPPEDMNERSRAAASILSQARQLQHQSRADTAREMMRKVLDDHENEEPTRRLAQAAIAESLGRNTDAIKMLQPLAEDVDFDLRIVAQFLLGSALRAVMRVESARTAWESVEKSALDPWGLWAKNNLADIYEVYARECRRRHDPAGARDYTQKALSLYDELYERAGHFPNFHIDLYNMGCIKLRHNLLDEARERYLESLRKLAEKHGIEVSRTPPSSDWTGWKPIFDGCVQKDAHFCGMLARDLGTLHFRLAATRCLDTGPIDMDWTGRNVKPVWRGYTDLTDPDLLTAKNWWNASRDGLKDVSNEFEGDADRVVLVEHKLNLLERVLEGSGQDFVPETDAYRILGLMPEFQTGMDGYATPEERIYTKMVSSNTTRYEAYARQFNQMYEAHRRGEDTDGGFRGLGEDCLTVLRGWSSSVPLVNHGMTEYRGGGYLLRWRGKGLAIDPGIDFLYNLQRERFHLGHIDAVAVSHAHPDHNLDLVPFDDLRYELNRTVRKADPRNWNYVLLIDEDTLSQFKQRFPHRVWPGHREVFPFDLSGYVRSPQTDRETQVSEERTVVNLRKTQAELPFRIHYFKVEHSEDVPAAVGMRIDCLDDAGKTQLRIGYSADTQYFPELANPRHLAGCDILILHISEPGRWELMDPAGEKWDKHLGYRGVEKLLNALRDCRKQNQIRADKPQSPEVIVLGEFWGGLGNDYRIEITEGLRNSTHMFEAVNPTESSTATTFLPSSVGMTLSLGKDGHVRAVCSNCGQLTTMSSLTVVPAQIPMGPLGYVCARCLPLRN